MARLLAECPSLIDAVDADGYTALHYAANNGHEPLMRKLLAIQPEAIEAITNEGSTVLHLLCASQHFCSKELLERVWRLQFNALYLADNHGHTPLHVAIRHQKAAFIEVFQASLTFDEVVSAFDAWGYKSTGEERLRPLLETQCECLKTLLNQDVKGTVFEYLGFERIKQSNPFAQFGFP